MPRRASGLPSMLDLVMGAAASAARAKAESQRPPWPLNPFPSGVRVGSVTDRVLQVLRSRHPRWHEHRELMRLTGASRGGIAWAVRYLQEHGLVRSIPSARHPNYHRYQAVLASPDKAKTRAKEIADDADRH